jgi:hypothetical protein
LYTFDWHAIAGLAAGRTGPYEFASGTACPIPAAHGHGRGNRAAARQRPTRKAAVKVISLELSGRLCMQKDWMAVFGGVSGDLSRADMDQVRGEDLYRQR